MAERVAHLAGEPVVGEHLLGELVGLPARDAGTQQRLDLLVRLADRLVGVAHARARLAEEHGARHVGAIPPRPRAEIHHHALPRLQDGVAGNGMRARPVGAGRHDGGKREVVGAMAAHVVVELDLNLALGHAGSYEPDDVRERGVGYRLGGAHAGDLVGVLHRAQPLDDAVRLAQRCPRARFGKRPLERPELAQRHVVLDAQDVDRPARRRRELRVRDAPIVDRHLIAERVRGAAHRLGITRIGMEDGAVARQQQRMRALLVEHAVESREPPDAGGVADEEGVDARLGADGAQPSDSPARAGHPAPPCSLPCPCP